MTLRAFDAEAAAAAMAAAAPRARNVEAMQPRDAAVAAGRAGAFRALLHRSCEFLYQAHQAASGGVARGRGGSTAATAAYVSVMCGISIRNRGGSDSNGIGAASGTNSVDSGVGDDASHCGSSSSAVGYSSGCRFIDRTGALRLLSLTPVVR